MAKKTEVLLLLLLFLFTSCQNAKPIKRLSNEGFLYAMIYDNENTPVSGVAVYLNGKLIVESDIQGRFVLEKMKKAVYSVKLTKKGYETLEENFKYDPMQVLYFKMINASQLLVMAETALDNSEFADAENHLDRALLLEPNRPDILFLKSITCFLQKRNKEAVEILEGLIKSGSTDPSVSQLLEKITLIQKEEG
jgi:tetratricopeptide (TPR) repeat protein